MRRTVESREMQCDSLLAQGQVRVFEMIARGASLPDILDSILEVSEEQYPATPGSILLLDDLSRLRDGAARQLPLPYRQAIDGLSIGPNAGSCGTAAYLGEAVVAEDIRTDPRWERYRQFALPLGLLSCWSTPIFDAQHSVLGTFALYGREPGQPTPRHRRVIAIITHLASIAITRQRTENALRRVESRHRRLVNSNILGVVVADAQGRVTEANDAFLNLVGFNRGELEAGKLTWENLVAPDWESAETKAALKIGSRGGISSYELELVRKDKQLVPIRTSAARLDEEAGSCLRLVEDLSGLKREEARLRQSEKLAAIGQLAGGVAHDFNNQLGIILGCAEMLAARPLDAEARRLVETLASTALQSGELTRNLLTFSRQSHTHIQPVAMHGLIGEVVDLLRPTLDKRITIHTDLKAPVSSIAGDAAALKNAFLNLALNARDAMPDGGTLTFSTALHKASEDGAEGMTTTCLNVTVADTGLGMTPEVREKLFEPFFTTKAIGKGTGLGLASVHGTVKQHQASIAVESEVGKGTRFHLFFPLATATSAAQATSGSASDAKARPTPTSSKPTPNAATLRLLLVEDEPWLRELSAEMLVLLGHSVHAVSSGREALADYKKLGPFDLVMLDMAMPDWDGTQTFHALRQLDPKARILIASGYAHDEKLQALIEAGALGCLHKPYSRAQLAAALQTALQEPL
jgi:PAS domain S-box-containing protein